MKEIRCENDGKLLGRFEGQYEIKCPRCGFVNRGSTYTEKQDCIMKTHIPLDKRKTSSGVTFR